MTNLGFKPGLCCISKEMYNQGNKFKTMRLTAFKNSCTNIGLDKSLDKLHEIYLNNVNVLIKHIEYCQIMGYNYRIGSVFPLFDITPPQAMLPIWATIYHRVSGTTPNKISDFYNIYFSSFTSPNDVRLSTHPDQYVVLASDNIRTSSNAINVLNDDESLLSHLTNRTDKVINVHMSISKPNIPHIKNNLKIALKYLNTETRNMLCFENEDKGIWTVENLYYDVYQKFGIPITFDYLHHKCNPGSLTEEQAIKLAYSTWDLTKGKPLFHYSESIPGDKNPRKHSDYPTCRPNTYGLDIDIDYEFKMKDHAILKA